MQKAKINIRRGFHSFEKYYQTAKDFKTRTRLDAFVNENKLFHSESGNNRQP